MQPQEELRGLLRAKLKAIRRAEWHRRRGKERARKRTNFIANPFGFARKLFGDKRSGMLERPVEEINAHLSNTFSDPSRDVEVDNINSLISPEPPSVEFNDKPPTWKEIQEVVKAARTSAAPGPNGVPYTVYKRCPGILNLLWKVLRTIWRRGRVADQWRQAEGVWIPKEEKSKEIDQFRIISLLNTEGKIFFSILSRRLSKFLIMNEYIDTSVQKGGVAGIPGCIENTGVVSQLILEAKENNGNLAVLWLDLANAYGSIPHKVVEETLRRYHVPSSFSNLILDYYNNFNLRVTSGTKTSDWHRLERGIITGCTISATLFSLAMNMIIKSAEVECRGPRVKSGIRQPPLRAYMDDITVTTSSVIGCTWIVRGLEKLIVWARMRFKPGKSRSLVLQKGKIKSTARFTIADEFIPTVTEKPVKSLGKWFDSSTKDQAAIKGIWGDLDDWLRKIDKSGLPGKFKAWLYQHAILPRILWPLMLYEVAITTVEGMERKISGYLRRWLGLPKSLSSAALYGTSNAIQLPFRGLKEEFVVTRTREAIMYRDSRDLKVAGAGIEIRTGRKWSAVRELKVAEERLQQKAMVGTVASGTRGLGYYPSPRIDNARGKERRALLQKEVREGIEETRLAKMVGLSQQGAWTRWENYVRRRITWSDLWKADLSQLRFHIQAVYDLLLAHQTFTHGAKMIPQHVSCAGVKDRYSICYLDAQDH